MLSERRSFSLFFSMFGYIYFNEQSQINFNSQSNLK